jgi:hypothetical protein
VPESLLDDSEGFEGLPYVALFYRYLPGGFSLTKRVHGVHQDKPKRPLGMGKAKAPTVPSYTKAEFLKRVKSDKAEKLKAENLYIKNLQSSKNLEQTN